MVCTYFSNSEFLFFQMLPNLLVMPFTCAIKEIKTDSTFLVELMMGFNLFTFKKYNNHLLMQEQYQKQLYD